MKIIIPKEYNGDFEDNIVYLTPWKKPTLLLMNRAENEDYQRILQGSRVDGKDGITRFFKASVIALAVDNGAIDVPEGYWERLEGENRAFTREKAGIVLS